MQKNLFFRQKLSSERRRRGWSQEELASQLGVDFRTVSRWERGKSLPRPQAMKKLYTLLEIRYEEVEIKAETMSDIVPAPDNMPRPHEAPGSHTETTILISQQAITNTSYDIGASEGNGQNVAYTLLEDWSDAPRTLPLYGREEELAELRYWIIDEKCPVVAVLGMGGIGKTVLAAKLAEKIKASFRYVFWRSLHNVPPLKHLLTQCLLFLIDRRRIRIPEDVDDQISLLIEYLQKQRCLLIFDNVESLLQVGTSAGHYREGYGDYGRLIQRLSVTPHQSCLLMTSREKPEEVARLEGRTALVRSLSLQGLALNEGQLLLKDKGLSGTLTDWQKLIQLYAGNPLALQLISEPVQEIFGGSIASFLQLGATAFDNIINLLEQQFVRLSSQEQEVLYWLAIEREVLSLEQLHENLVHSVPRTTLLTALNSLRRRSMIETRGPGLFTLQSAIMEYVTQALVELFVHTFTSEASSIWSHYLFIKAQTKEYVHESQRQLILLPVAQNLLETLGRKGIEQRARVLLDSQRQTQTQHHSYLATNLLYLLSTLQCDLRKADFSHLVILQAHLQHMLLPEVNFEHAQFVKSVFTTTSGNVLSLAFSPHDDRLATGTTDGEIWIYAATSGTPLLICQGHTDAVWSVAFSPNEELLTSCSDDGTIRLWDTTTGQCLNVLEGHGDRVKAVAFHPNGTMLASGSQDQTVRLWDVKSAAILDILHGHSDRIWSVAFSPDGRLLASCSTDQTIRLWDIQSGRCLRALTSHEPHWILSVAFSPDGTLLASGGDDQTIHLWDVASATCLKILSGHTNRVRTVAFSADGTILASGSEDHNVRLWDIESGQCLKTLFGHTRGVRAIAFNASSDLLASGGDDQATFLWDTTTGQCLKTLRGHTNRPWSIAFNADARQLVSCNEDQSISVWDIESQRCMTTLSDHAHGARAIACSPQDALIVSGGEDRSVRLWNMSTGQCHRVLHGHTHWVRCVAFSPDSLNVASGSEDLTVRIWDTNTGQCLQVLQGHHSWVRCLAFSPDNTLLASGGDDQAIYIWDRASHASLFTLQGHIGSVRSLAFSPDGHILASGGEDLAIVLWKRAGGQYIRSLQEHEGWIRSLAFSPDGHILASSSDDQTIRLWDVQSGRCLRILQGHNQRVRGVAFSSDGQMIASCSDDGFIKLWHTQTGACFHTLMSERPYERMNITGAQGLTAIQRSILKALGAIENA